MRTDYFTELAKLPQNRCNWCNRCNHDKKSFGIKDLSRYSPVTPKKFMGVTGVTNNAAANDVDATVTPVTPRLRQGVTEGSIENSLNNKHLSGRLHRLHQLHQKTSKFATQRLPTAQPINDDLTFNELEAFEERAAILEYDAGFSRADAERKPAILGDAGNAN